MAVPLRLVKMRPTGAGRARGLVSSKTSGRRVESETYAASPELADVVAAFWTGRWDLRGQPPHRTELLGDPCVHLVFERGGAHAGSRLVGVWTRLWRRTLAGRGMVRGVKCRAGAARAFLPEPAFRFANRTVPLKDVFGEANPKLERAVLDAESDEEGFAALGEWLSLVRREHDQTSFAIALVERIVGDPELTSVDELAAAAGVGPRVLQRIFREHVGASPKWVINRNRIQEAALQIERGNTVTLAALAAKLGYTDQAHLARDFKKIVGKTPTEFATLVQQNSWGESS